MTAISTTQGQLNNHVLCVYAQAASGDCCVYVEDWKVSSTNSTKPLVDSVEHERVLRKLSDPLF